MTLAPIRIAQLGVHFSRTHMKVGSVMREAGEVHPLTDPRIVTFYTQHEAEADRLGAVRNRLEFVRTQQLLRGLIPPASAILDVGGAAGAHASWLAEDGHTVEIIDPVPLHIDQAHAASRVAAAGFTAQLGDARQLAAADGTVDVCLLFGPLYHLIGDADRVLALKEAVRVCRPGGLVIAAAISRTAWPLYELRNGATFTDDVEARVRRAITDGVQDTGETTFYSHRPEDLRRELEAAGARDVKVLGIEGPGWILFAPEMHGVAAENLLGAAVKAAQLCDLTPEAASASAHLLGVARRPA